MTALLLTVLSLVAAACSSSSTTEGGGTTEVGGEAGASLNLAFFVDMQVPDPDIFYEVEGNQVITSTYEGLLRYSPENTTEIEPLLAERYEVSPDGLTYTFTLRQGVTFVDGTPFDSAAARFSFERRTKVGSAPSYMLADVAAYETPDPSTFVIKLSQPVSPFLDYLAAPYGPKMVSPALINANEVDGDAAQDWIKTNSAGTGPYRISEFSLGQRYVLSRVEDYWGEAPYYDDVVINIVPDAATQQLQLEGGDLDIIRDHPIDTVKAFRDKEGFTVTSFDVLRKQFVHVNQHKAPFDDKAVRQALQAAIDRETLVAQVHGDTGSPSTSMYPVSVMEAGLGDDPIEFDGGAALKAAVAALPEADRSITFTYPIGVVNDQRMTETLSQALTEAGFEVTIQPKTVAEIFDMVNAEDPATLPDLLIETANPDAAHPDTWIRIFMRTGGALNYLQASNPAADAAMDKGLNLVDEAEVAAAYGEAGDLLHDDATFLTIADVKDTFISRSGIGGLSHQIPTALTLHLNGLAPTEK
ncbi:MAG: ABC transporter substrate-binding protein [Acidimicrobiia bacterium]